MEHDRIEIARRFYDGMILNLVIINGITDKYVINKTDDMDADDIAIHDLLAHITLFQIDLSIASKHLIINRVSGNIWETNYFARAISVHLCDILQSGPEGVRKRINTVLKRYYGRDEHTMTVQIVKQLKKIITKISNDCLAEVEEIRTHLFAHKLGDGLQQHVKMQQIDVMKLLFIGGDVHDALAEIARKLCDLFGRFKTVSTDEPTTAEFLNSINLYKTQSSVP